MENEKKIVIEGWMTASEIEELMKKGYDVKIIICDGVLGVCYACAYSY